MNRSARRHIPSFSLYGEQSAATRHTDPLHIEDIQSRSRKYLWKIGPHRHIGLCQCVYVTAGPVSFDLEGSHAEFEGPAVFIIPSGTVHGFGFQADTLGYVLTADLDRLLSMASAAHHTPIARLFSVPRAIDLAPDRLLAARAAQVFEILMQEFRQPESVMVPVSGWLACALLWVLASGSVTAPPAGSAAALSTVDRVPLFETLAGEALRETACAFGEQLEPGVPQRDRRYRLRSHSTEIGLGGTAPPGLCGRFGCQHCGGTGVQRSRLFLPLLPQAHRIVPDGLPTPSG
jgi:hypothetical protein